MFKKLQKAGTTFSLSSLNVFNELFYKYAERKLIDELPNLFTKLDLFNIALHQKITTKLDSKVIKVMELASGKKIDRWDTFIKTDRSHEWKVLLTDFDKSLLPNPNMMGNVTNFKFRTAIYSLFESFPKLKLAEKHDVILSSYTFDNLWLEDDLSLEKINKVWYQKRYQLDLSKIEGRLADIKKGKRLDRQFFKDLRIKTKMTKTNLSSIKHGAHIDKYYENQQHVRVNYPGGLIKTVVNSFYSQLKRGGIFITADIAMADKSQKTNGFRSVNEVIKIKIENYDLAKYILEKLGYKVELKNLHEFINEAGIITPVKIHDHFVLIVKLKD